MSVIRVGSSNTYAEGWAAIFEGKAVKKTAKLTAKKAKANKKATAKKKPAKKRK